VLRNLSLHFGTPSERLNEKIGNVFRAAITAIGAAPDDPQQNWLGDPFTPPHFSMHEVHAGNPLHLLLLVIALVVVILAARKGSGWKNVWYAVGILAGFLFFCASLRWHLWMSRLQLPIFVLGAALTGFVLEKHFPKRAANTIATILVACGLLFSVSNRIRSFVPWTKVNDIYHPRAELYFLDEHKSFAAENIAAAAEINNSSCKQIGLDTYSPETAIRRNPPSFFVYPILALIHADGGGRAVWYSGVTNATRRYSDLAHHGPPCLIVCMECAAVPEKWRQYTAPGGSAKQFGGIVVFSRPANPL
jgi:hypothetical protein